MSTLTILKQGDVQSLISSVHKFETKIKLGKKQTKNVICLPDLLPLHEKFVISIDSYGAMHELVIGCQKGQIIISETDKNLNIKTINCLPGEKYIVKASPSVYVSFLAKTEKNEWPAMACLEINRQGGQLIVGRHKDAQTAFS